MAQFIPLVMQTIQTQRKYDALVGLLAQGSYTREELEDKLFCSKTRVIDLLRMLMRGEKYPRQVRIARWLRMRGGFCAMYAIGSVPDAPKPKRYSAGERHYRIQANAQLKKSKNEKLVAAARRRRKKSMPGIHDKVLGVVTSLISGTTPEIAVALKMAYSTTYCILRELEEEKKVMRRARKGKFPIRWSVYVEGLEHETMPNQAVVKTWQAPKVKAQNPFSALGL